MATTAEPRWAHVNAATKPSEQTITDAYVYLLGRALVVRQELLDREESGFAYNSIKYNPLGSAEFVNPNLDVAYLEAWIAVDDSTIVLLDVPEIEGRYYTAQLLDEWGEVIVNINERTFPTRPFGRYALVTPDSTAAIPEDVARIELHSNKAKLLGRVELKGDRDGAVRLQRQFKLTTLGEPVITAPPRIPIFHNKNLIGAEIFADVDATLGSALDVSPVAAEMQQKVRAVAAYVSSSNKARAAIDTQLHEVVPELQDYAMTRCMPSHDHWVGGGITGNYGRNYWLRATVNYAGMWANPPDEVVYSPATHDADGRPLDGCNSYVMHFPAHALPQSMVDAYWSVILVGVPDYRVIPNELDRYNVNTYSLLQHDADGSLTIGIGAQPVPGVAESNWLPAPADKPFALTFRAYVPKDLVRQGGWHPAAVTRVSSNGAGRTLDTRIGTLEFTHDFANGYPTPETIERLYDERDFQRACQAYLWALPAVSFAQWQRAQSVFGAGSGGIVEFTTYDGKVGILTANATTPYYVGFADLSTGPLVIEMPSGVRGGITDAWQRNIPDSEAPASYLVLGPGQPEPDDVRGYAVRRSPTFNILFGIRITVTDPDAARAALAQLRIYPYGARPTAARIVSGSGKAWSGVPPRGIEYWQRLSEVIEREPVEDRDRFFHAMLEPLGIEKDMMFAPNARQAKLLTEAALVGEAMAKVNTANRRFVDALYRPQTHWEAALLLDADHPDRFWDLLDQRSAWFYEAVTAAPSMAPKRPGPSSAYLGAYKDAAGNWLDGATTYRLRVPAKPPVDLFWSVTIYDVDTRCLIQNEQKIADRSSRMDLRANKDGSVDIYCGPKPPEGFEANWIPTVPGRNWFAYFRFYEPTTAYFERTWPLPDFSPC